MLNKNLHTPLDGEIERARDLYQDDELQIDDNAMVSPAGDGIWVQAWVWLPHERGE